MPKVQLAGATVLLTGATGGIGRAIARELTAHGARLVLTGRRAGALHSLATEFDAQVITADLAQPGAAARLRDAAGPVDVLIANAGVPAAGRLREFTPERIEMAVGVNLRAPMTLAHAFGAAMCERGDGHLVFMGSIASQLPAPCASVYNATKFGLRGFALGLRHEMGEHGVGVSIVEPGFIRSAGMFADSGTSLPLGIRTLAPEHVAAAVVRAIRDDVDEIVVAPLELRLGAMMGCLAPGLLSPIQRLIGADKVSSDFGASFARG
ncbi:SDR family NAD(P)-dependent oxidoreductase [Nocardia sp. NPDC005978]|uniref:SDR family NAD(P)-dependent oxidoreductase n=1 Tax=unclassified Nocardia TaxID=2637762 RepID=UPI0033A06076